MSDKITAPVLLIAFNRPDTTKIVFDKIRDVRPIKLYVALDGPRLNKEREEILCKEVQDIVRNVDWTCEVYYKINEINKGAEVTVSSAISWVLQNEEYVIILEDDIVAPMSFFYFMQEMLERYKNDHRIGIVSGCNYTPIDCKGGEDYFFAKYGHSWGWGTWKRTWDKFDLNTTISDEHLSMKYLKTISNSKAEAGYYRKKFLRIKKNGPGNSTWDNIGGYIFRVNGYMNIVPRVNLTSNIGIYGLHANGINKHYYRPFDETFKVIKHPAKIELNVEYDKHHFKTYINRKRPIFSRILKKINNLFR